MEEAPLRDRDVPDDPLLLFERWYGEARASESGADVVALATASAEARPSVRMVELQEVDGGAFVVYTGRASRKGRELEENPRAALCFYWRSTGHQVRVEGPVSPAPLDEEEREAAAVAAGEGAPRQDEPVADRADLEARVEGVRRRYGEHAASLPADWGGYRLVPDAYEFWQYRDDRLHDRFRYRLRDAGGWEVERLFP